MQKEIVIKLLRTMAENSRACAKCAAMSSLFIEAKTYNEIADMLEDEEYLQGFIDIFLHNRY